MTPNARLLEYVNANELSHVDGNWMRLERFFTENALLEVSGGPPLGGHWEGRVALIAHLREVAETFDRLFDERLLWPRGALVQMGATVALPWRAIYRLDRAPAHPLTIEGTKVASFASDLIELLRDQLRVGTDRLIQSYFRHHGLPH